MTPSTGSVRKVSTDVDDAVTDEELADLAMAADPDAEVGDDAVAFDAGGPAAGLLPAWYMPAAHAGGARRRHRVVVVAIIAALVIVNGAGLCVTYGFPEIAW